MSAKTMAAALAVAGAWATAASGQVCEGQWLPGYGVPGVNGSVNAMTLWDPDGAGPLPEVLVIGGSFSIVQSTPANNIAIWDGQQWSALGSGTSGTVRALEVYDGKLWVGGSFTTAGGVATGPLASWDGTSWGSAGVEPISINALQVYQGELVAAGNLKISGAGTSIAKWNGSAWSLLGPGSAIGSGINALTVYQNNLIAAGSFTSAGGLPAGGIAAWDGAWKALGTGIETAKSIRALCVYNGQLFAGGNFSTIGGVQSLFLGRWTGLQWEATGLPVTSTGISPGVNALTVFDGRLVVGGDTVIQRINTWDGVAWGSLGQWIEGAVLRLQPFRGSLFAGTEGNYHSTAVGRGIVEYSGGTWKSIGIGFDDVLSSLASYDDRLFLSGQIDQLAGAVVRTIGQWNGATWSSVGTNSPITVTGMRAVDGLLFAAGFNGVSAWNGSAWSSLPGLISSFGSVSLSEYQGEVLAVGRLRLTGLTGDRPVAAWTGTQWRTFGTDLVGQVQSAVEYEGDLVVIGSFPFLQLTSNPTARGPFRFDGSEWHPWPVALSSSGTLFVYNGKLMVASSDVRSANAVSYGAIAQWEGDHWASVGGGVYGAAPVGQSVRVLREYKGDLIAAGSFTLAGGVAVNNIARWNGSEWQAMGGGLTGGTVIDVQQHRDELIAIGTFTKADGAPSAYFARWTDDPKPWLAVQPQSKPVNQSLTLSLRASAASGCVNVSYQWKRNGAAVQDGPAGASVGGGLVSGAAGALASPSDGADVVLRIDGVQASDAGEYTVEFSNACNTTSSWTAAVTINTCPGDLNADGFVDDDDFNLFAAAYDAMLCDDPAMPIGCLSDWNGDGVVDDRDFQLFVVAYGTMVCD